MPRSPRSNDVAGSPVLDTLWQHWGEPVLHYDVPPLVPVGVAAARTARSESLESMTRLGRL